MLVGNELPFWKQIGHVLLEEEVMIKASTALFDEFGRRMPYAGMRTYNTFSRRYYRLSAHYNVMDNFFHGLSWVDLTMNAQKVSEILKGIREGLWRNPELSGLLKGVAVPFFCPQRRSEAKRGEELKEFVRVAGQAFTEAFPGQEFLFPEESSVPENLVVAENSRYQAFEDARLYAPVVGYYFPACLSEYDVASQRAQMTTLPVGVQWDSGSAAIVLSGVVEAAMAICSYPGLLVNTEKYPPILCLSAVQDPDPRFVYSFEAYGLNLAFRRRSQMLTTELTQVSEQWAGGLTVFASL